MLGVDLQQMLMRVAAILVQKNFIGDSTARSSLERTRAALARWLQRQENNNMHKPDSSLREQVNEGGAAHPVLQERGSTHLAGDILHGADAVADFLFGSRKLRRRVYNLVEDGKLPVFRIGVNICARKSVLTAWIEAQERMSAGCG